MASKPRFPPYPKEINARRAVRRQVIRELSTYPEAERTELVRQLVAEWGISPRTVKEWRQEVGISWAKPPVWGKQEIERARADIAAGRCTRAQAAKRYGMSLWAINHYCKDLPAVGRVKPDLKAKAIELVLDRGHTAVRVAKAMGHQAETVQRWAREARAKRAAAGPR